MHDAPLEAREHTEHVTEHHDHFVARVAILISLLAVLAAVSGNLESIEAEKSLGAATEATLQQDKATDSWSEYQADSLKRHLYTIAAEMNQGQAAKYAKTADEQQRRQTQVRERALKAEQDRSRLIAESGAHESRHHWLTAAATLFEIAIALATVSIITRRHWLWGSGALLGVAGIVLLATAFAS